MAPRRWRLKKPEVVGLVLSDINMPNMDGLEFLTKVRAERDWQRIPIVMVSTEGTHAKVLEAVERGASGLRPQAIHRGANQGKTGGIAMTGGGAC